MSASVHSGCVGAATTLSLILSASSCVPPCPAPTTLAKPKDLTGVAAFDGGSAAEATSPVGSAPTSDAGARADVDVPAACIDASPDYVRMCGKAWAPSAAFLVGLRKLVKDSAWLSEGDFSVCANVDPFCTYGIALAKKWSGHLEEYETISEQLISSGKLDSCTECKIIVLRDLGWFKVTHSPKGRTRGTEYLHMSCSMLASKSLEIRLFGHASACRLLMDLGETGDEERKRLLVTQRDLEPCGVTWQNSCSARASENLFLSDIWW